LGDAAARQDAELRKEEAQVTELALLGLYEAVARRYLNYLEPNTCVEQTRILIEVLRKFGVEAEAFGVVLVVKCPSKGFQFVAGMDEKEAAEGRKKVTASWIEKTNSDGLTYPGRHVVALVNRSILVDATVSQASNTEFDFHLDRQILVVPFPKPLLPGRHVDALIQAATEDGCQFTIEYLSRPERDWEKDDGWEPSHLWKLIDRIAEEMLQRIAEDAHKLSVH
jgi:hypothetical protein